MNEFDFISVKTIYSYRKCWKHDSGEIGTAICLFSLKSVSVKSKCTHNSFNMGLVLNNMPLIFYIPTPVALPPFFPDPLPSVLVSSTPPSFLFWNRQTSDVYWQNMTHHVAVRLNIFPCIKKSRQDNPVWGRGSQKPTEDSEIPLFPPLRHSKEDQGTLLSHIWIGPMSVPWRLPGCWFKIILNNLFHMIASNVL